MIENISFCILHSGRDERVFNRCVNSILKQQAPRFEILACGNRCDHDKVKFIENKEWIENGEFNRMRNFLCSNTSADFAVLMTENIELSDGWYEAIRHADCLDIVASRIETENNVRVVDWAYRVMLGSRGYPCPLEYDEWTTKAYVSDELMLLRKRAWERVKYDETLTFDRNADEDFCLRASKAGFRIGVFPEAKAKYIGKNLLSKRDLSFEKSENTVRAFRRAFTAGKEAIKSRDYVQALNHLTEATETVPDDPVTLSLIGWAHYFSGSYEQAIHALSEAINIDPANHPALRGRGWALLQVGAYEKAVSDLSRALETVNPNHRDEWVETVRGLSWSYYHSANYQEAIRHFRSLAEKSHGDERGLLQDVYRGLGWSCYRINEFGDAAAYFNLAISNIDDDNHELLKDAKHGLRLASSGAHQANSAAEDNAVSPEAYAPVTLLQNAPPPSGNPRGGISSKLRSVVKRLLNL